MSEGSMAHSVNVNSSEDTAERDDDDHSVSQQPAKVTSGGCDPIRMVLGFLCVLLLAVVIVVRVQYYTDVQTKEKLQMMINENNVLKKNLTDMQTNDPTDMQTKDKQTIEALQKNLIDVQLQTKEKLQMMMSENNVLKKNLTDMETKDIQNKDLQKTLTDMQTKDKQSQEALRQNLTDSITKLTSCQAKPFSCPPCIQQQEGATCSKPCARGWESYGGKCYRFSTNKHTWDQSKNDCKRQGADLVKIDSNDEQIFLQGKLMQKMAAADDKFWIGLTDSKIEGTWVWADGSPVETERFWSGREPDDWKGNTNTGPHPNGEDCVRVGEKFGSSDFKTWFDTFCDKPHKYICEKQADTGRVESTCV